MSDCDVFDTFEHMVLQRINRCLSAEEFRQLNNFDDWDDLYIKLFLSLYLQCCDLNGISYVKHTAKTIEPVTLHIDVKMTRDSDPVILHCISIPFLKHIYSSKTYKSVANAQYCSFNLPDVFPLLLNNMNNDIEFQNDIKMMNLKTSNLLLTFYCFADHAAYHYKKFKETGNADYTHECIINRSETLKVKDVKHCHDIITTGPNKYLNKYLTSHDVLKVEDREPSRNSCTSNYSSMFDNSTDSE